jgi:hypothetical protein
MPGMLTVQGTVKALQPIIHSANMPDEGMPAMGNQKFHRKMKVWYEGHAVQVPVISGNSIRGIMRRLGADAFLELLELDPNRIDRKLHYLLYSGGALEGGAAKGRPKKVKAGSEYSISSLREYIPLVSLMGGSFYSDLVQGKLIADFLIPYVDEVAELYGKPKPGIRAAEITDWLFYTRQDKASSSTGEPGSQMIYRAEYIMPGVQFIHSFTLTGANEVETALFYHLVFELNRWGRVGGRTAQGHGKVQFDYLLDTSHSPSPYFEYIHGRKSSILAFMKSCFGIGEE